MTQDDLLNRLACIHASVNATTEFEMTNLPAKVFQDGRGVGFFQDFAGNLSEHDIVNAARIVIHNMASLQDYLKRWAAKNGKDKAKVDETFKSSTDLRIIKDLWNNDKHGYRGGSPGHSGKAPLLRNVRREMRLTPSPRAGSHVVMTFGPGGVPKIAGDGTACAVITGDVVDNDGVRVDDLFDIQQRALEAWEALLKDFAVSSYESGDGT